MIQIPLAIRAMLRPEGVRHVSGAAMPAAGHGTIIQSPLAIHPLLHPQGVRPSRADLSREKIRLNMRASNVGSLIGALRICGRWISEQALNRLSRHSEGPSAPSRMELVKEFYRATGWHDAKGRLSISSANVALGKLESPLRV